MADHKPRREILRVKPKPPQPSEHDWTQASSKSPDDFPEAGNVSEAKGKSPEPDKAGPK